uniref:AMP-binding domain-containing protein n=1 Tax=Macrostomum lignano TaxID=282301 RepID=A0A1I8JPS3_9PLAT
SRFPALYNGRPLLTFPDRLLRWHRPAFRIALARARAQSSLIREDSPSSLPAHLMEALQRHAGEGSGKSLAHHLMESRRSGTRVSSSLKPGDRALSLLLLQHLQSDCALWPPPLPPVSCGWCGVPVLLNRRLLPTAETGQMLAALWRLIQHEPPLTGWGRAACTGSLADAQGRLTKPARRASSSRWPMLNAAQPETAAPELLCISRVALLSHGKALCSALGYGKGDTAVCLCDPRRDVGLWHGLVASMLADRATLLSGGRCQHARLSYGLVQNPYTLPLPGWTLIRPTRRSPCKTAATCCPSRLSRWSVSGVRAPRQSRPQLCRVDEVGEICRPGYAGNDSPNERAVFNCRPVSATETKLTQRDRATDGAFVRTGFDRLSWAGLLREGLLFVCGTIATQLCVAKRRHSAEDIIATVLAVEPLKFVYRGRIAGSPNRLLGDDRIRCAVSLLPACPRPGQLAARGPHGSVETVTVRDLYSAGRLRPCRVLMCPRPPLPTSCIASNLSSRRVSDRSSTSSSSAGPTLPCLTLTDALRWRASREPDTRLLSVCTDASSASDTDGDSSADTVDIVASCSVGEPLTAQGLLKRADRVASLIRTGLQLTASTTGAAAPGPDLLAGLFGRYAGRLRAAVMRPPAPAPSSLSAFARLRPRCRLRQVQPAEPRPPLLPPLLELDKKQKKVAEKAAASDSGDPNSKLASQTDPESAAYLDLCGAGSPQDDSLQTPGSSAPIGVSRHPPSRHGRLSVPADSLRPAAWPRPARLRRLVIGASASGAARILADAAAQRSVRDALCGYELLDRLAAPGCNLSLVKVVCAVALIWL